MSSIDIDEFGEWKQIGFGNQPIWRFTAQKMMPADREISVPSLGTIVEIRLGGQPLVFSDNIGNEADAYVRDESGQARLHLAWNLKAGELLHVTLAQSPEQTYDQAIDAFLGATAETVRAGKVVVVQ